MNEIIQLTQDLLNAIAAADWEAYTALCTEDLTAFEPEGQGHLIEGMSFHRFYFEGKAYGEIQSTVSSPHVRFVGDHCAVIAYVRLNQFKDENGKFHTNAFEETRVWDKSSGNWQHVHFHRS